MTHSKEYHNPSVDFIMSLNAGILLHRKSESSRNLEQLETLT